jgi:hypothetical protein
MTYFIGVIVIDLLDIEVFFVKVKGSRYLGQVVVELGEIACHFIN